ncbi:hypothetical protein SAMD00019534_094090 [Acytostelium subglobosum LB1]|uniref:hypothetical protein n=1 Tax=Acytostelium subglobosum LB1 TaxID=1410327 RepID=UPI00064504E7|nr:hypothetical protein SAMD00019534_094090 [Acytostelium subglobosum LB1]GAM26234.1 hypothetical protein SAMD00019534_094090 [Acytostelium subglobosum LB1]|eukprot:XP_012750788.1 hypothetical protein SAMD00019534_094090 [Acytostelium subglobosum LB1]
MKSLLKKAKNLFSSPHQQHQQHDELQQDEHNIAGDGAVNNNNPEQQHSNDSSTKSLTDPIQQHDEGKTTPPDNGGFIATCEVENSHSGSGGEKHANSTASPTPATAPAATAPASGARDNSKPAPKHKPSLLNFNLSGKKDKEKEPVKPAAMPKSTTPDSKKEEERVPDAREIIYIKGLEDLPDDCLKLVKLSGLSEEKMVKNMQVLLHVLYFRTGKNIRMEGEPPREPRKKFVSERFNDGETLLVPVEPGQLKKLYKDPDQVGKGGFGTVYFARSTKEKKMVAIKKMPHVTKRQIQQNFREASILAKCNHPNIVKLITCHLDKDQNLWLIMEFMEGGTFEEAARAWRFNENNLAYIARELLKGLQYLHENGMVHRDLKSANIMMSVEGKIKLIDFGLCEDVSTSSPCHMVGSPFWMAPEMILGKPHNTAVDIWSFAVSLLEMANQRPPMMESAVKAMFTVATEGSTGFDEPELWSNTFKDFLSKCLKLDPAERATAVDLLKHPFIKKADSRDNMEGILKKIFLTNSLMNSGF